jgi:3-demethoxyubiquinol 3-hydroxylase
MKHAVARQQSTRLLRLITTASAAYIRPSSPPDPATQVTPDLDPKQRAQLDAAIRVDQAGEVAANWIYAGQMAVLGHRRDLRPLLQDMWDQEKKHLTVMNALQTQHRTRPTALWPVAQGAGFLLGAATAMLGKEAAMACTEAVETAIGEHYDEYATASRVLWRAHEPELTQPTQRAFRVS